MYYLFQVIPRPSAYNRTIQQLQHLQEPKPPALRLLLNTQHLESSVRAQAGHKYLKHVTSTESQDAQRHNVPPSCNNGCPTPVRNHLLKLRDDSDPGLGGQQEAGVGGEEG